MTVVVHPFRRDIPPRCANCKRFKKVALSLKDHSNKSQVFVNGHFTFRVVQVDLMILEVQRMVMCG